MNIQDLKGTELDRAVANAFGIPGAKVMRTALVGNGRGHKQEWYELDYPAYSADWRIAGPLIEQYKISIGPGLTFPWYANVGGRGDEFAGATPLIAAMRALVAHKLGVKWPGVIDENNVPGVSK